MASAPPGGRRVSIALLTAPDRSGWLFARGLLVCGVRLGLVSAQLTSVILTEIPPEEPGRAAVMQSPFGQIGAALGIALLGTVSSLGLRNGTQCSTTDIPGLPESAQGASSRPSPARTARCRPGLARTPGSEPVVSADSDAFASAATRTGLVAVVFVVDGFIVSARLPDIRYADKAATAIPSGR